MAGTSPARRCGYFANPATLITTSASRSAASMAPTVLAAVAIFASFAGSAASAAISAASRSGVLMQAGGAIRLEQSEFTPDRLAAEIAALAAEPAKLANMAAAAKTAGAIDAADRLADVVLKVAGLAK